VAEDPTGTVAELLSRLIANACVNDGTAPSGHEHRNAAVLRSVLEGPGLDLQTYEPAPGRQSLVARIEGRDPAAPTLVLLGHTDVVPANPDGWQRDPFGGELVDGVVWGRGAVDMLNLTSSMALATRRLADTGWRPRGTLVFVGVADEEALGEHGAAWLVEHAWDTAGGDYVITESGGVPLRTPVGTRLGVTVGEKGAMWSRLVVKGTPGHASRPLRTDNALVTAARVVQRLAEFRGPAIIGEAWAGYVRGMAFDADLTAALLDPERLDEVTSTLPRLDLARTAHACTHLTMAPTVMHAGTKTNVIPDHVVLDVDVRTLPGQTAADVHAALTDAIGPELAGQVEVVSVVDDAATASPVATPLWDAIGEVAGGLAPGATCLPTTTTGATDARFYRRHGATAYGFGLFSEQMTPGRFSAMFHGDDERIDVESLRLSVELWERLARRFLD
jgi:acetylornithine deacetylase/succinyl-diaminopimelate desuccinylase-like protein